MSQETQETKVERACAAVTPTEKRQLEWVAKTLEFRGELPKDGGVSQLLRKYSVDAALGLFADLIPAA